MFYKWSLDFAFSIQSMNLRILDYFFYGVAFLGGEIAFILILIHYFAAQSRIEGFKSVILFCTAGYTTQTIKLMYAFPRPYLYDSRIKPIMDCYYEYGRPSGHAYISLLVYLYLVDRMILDWRLFKKDVQKQSEAPLYPRSQQYEINLGNQAYTSYEDGHNYIEGQVLEENQEIRLKKIIIFAVTLTLLFIVGFSRVYLGMHTWDQVVLGWVLSLIHI
eukprot:TRINITY_DN6817_c0_g3_i1.p1 TRINITY_DN6817_c0_g3~~TRINITY_DN6817_c0_g3_i1.p1  ORF type:complete len:218 (+),score=0.79 TRINITY_DN6817_c0_g3_i1:58-711(+)